MSSTSHITENISTNMKPYHYVGSGLPNVYLVGVKYTPFSDGEQSAEIPCLPELLKAIAKAIVGKKTSLTGDEVRFLRKRMRITSKSFAEVLGFSSAEHYCRLETGAAEIQHQTELLIRFYYAAFEKLNKLSHELTAAGATTKWEANFDHQQRILASKDKQNVWHVELVFAAA